ncbi:MAG TPA: hypothetical protein ENK61_05420, partial [Devosia sp.]|nr:hypothetical protein [Devosia sp.]
MNAFNHSIADETGSLIGFEPREKVNSSVIEMCRVAPEQWDGYISQFEGAAQEQMYAFTKGRWPNVKCEPNLFYIQGRLVGGAMIMVQSIPGGIGQI